MPIKAKQVFTATIPEIGVVAWDTTLRPFCKQLKEKYPDALGYDSLFRKMKGDNEFKYEFTSKIGNKFIIQKLVRD